MKYLLLLSLSLLISFNALAAPVSYERPTMREDDTELLPAEIANYNVYCGMEQGGYTDKTVIARDVTSFDSAILERPTGVSYCVITTVDTDGRESVYSNEVLISGLSRPNAPTVTTTIVISVRVNQ